MNFNSPSARKPSVPWPGPALPPKAGEDGYLQKFLEHARSNQEHNAGGEAASNLYALLKELSFYNPPKRVMGADGKVYLALAKDSGSGEVASMGLSWQVEVVADPDHGGRQLVTIAGGSSIFDDEFSDWTMEVVNYDWTTGYSHSYIADRLVCFEVDQDENNEISLISITLRDPANDLYTLSTSGDGVTQYISTIKIPFAYIDADGWVNQFVKADVILCRENMGGFPIWWRAA